MIYSSGFSQDTLVVERLEYRLVVLSDNEALPAVHLDKLTAASVSYECPKVGFLEICGVSGYDVWVNGRYLTHKQAGKCVQLPANDFCEGRQSTVLLSLSTDENLDGVSLRLLQLIPERQLLQSRLSIRSFDRGAWWMVSFLVLGVLILMYRELSPAPLLQFFTRTGTTYYQSQLLAENKTFTVLFVALFASFDWTYVYVAHFSLVSWLSAFGALLLFFLMVRLVQQMGALLFGLKELRDDQFNGLTQLSLAVGLVLMFFCLFDFLVLDGDFLSKESVKWMLFTVYAGYLLRRVLKVMFKSRLLKLHLFAYLCTTEILPVVYIIYWILYN